MAVLFLIEISKTSDFAKASNFIYKVIERQKLNSDETDHIYFKRIQEPGEQPGRKLCTMVLDWKSELRQIHTPETIWKTNSSTSIYFILYINSGILDEIMLYQNMFLLLNCYKTYNVYSLIQGDSPFYFKLSQYLSFSLQNTCLINNIFYNEIGTDSVRRLQTNGIELSTAFLPLIIVNPDNMERLKDHCSNQLGARAMKILQNSGFCETDDLVQAISWSELGGVVKIMSNILEKLTNIKISQLLKIIEKLDTLALIFLAYLLHGISVSGRNKTRKKAEKEPVDDRELNGYAELMQQYANACHQLMENIIFHSDAKWGIFSVRIHKQAEGKDKRYLTEIYGIQSPETVFFEINICDCAGGWQKTDIVTNLINSLPEEDKILFKNVSPKELFENNWTKKKNPWEQLYKKPEYIGKHFGLKIFRRILQENDGRFRAESRCGHLCQNEDTYEIHATKRSNLYGMPGTSYHLILPLDKKRLKISEKDTYQEYGDWLNTDPKRLLQIKSCVCIDLNIVCRDYKEQSEKNEIITAAVNYLLKNKNLDQKNVFVADVFQFEERYIEILVKVLIIYEYFLSFDQHIVLYNCTENFLYTFRTVMMELYDAGLENMFSDKMIQIMLISTENEQVVFVPGNAALTNGLNKYISKIHGRKCLIQIASVFNTDYADGYAKEYIPFDAIIRSPKGDTYFEQYVKTILDKDIQKEHFGCQINNTHMRLGSTIHINRFYEAELLFGNKYFVSRFAFLVLRDVYSDIKEQKKITLYGYGTYSESLLVELCNSIKNMDDGKDIDYIFLERKEERREFSHSDRIRYSRIFRDDQDRKAYMKDRKYILIVPINSTLKTHQRLIDLFKEENSLEGDEWILKNYALILVGPNNDNQYWTKVINKNGEKFLNCAYGINPPPRFFVEVYTNYEEPLTCRRCFPEKPMEECPLIEVNAASTIPNQAFGIAEQTNSNVTKMKDISNWINNEFSKTRELKDCLLYGHIIRNEEHYLYYLLTEQLVKLSEKKIRDSLKDWKENIQNEENEYHILVAPMHYSNCTFVELVNDIIFNGVAMILRIDFNKDFRSNVYTKYSNIRQYIKQLDETEQNAIVNFHYVDDSIITGRTYYRAKSLIESMAEYYHTEYRNVRLRIFDKIFILIDRNSKETRMQYIVQNEHRISELDKKYYTYMRLEISSLRNYGDSCVICNLFHEAELLRSTASTRIVSKYWENCNEKFGLISLEEAIRRKNKRYKEGKGEEYQERAYRRMFCSHMLKYILDRSGHGNCTDNILKTILLTLNTDYNIRQENRKEAFEYFISYLKVCSRPFLVFTKEIKEAILDILIAIIETVVKGGNISGDFSSLSKRYWNTQAIKREWNCLYRNILETLDHEEKRALVLVIMKQLTEMKSNYIIRLRNMEALYRFMVKNNEGSDLKDSLLKDFKYRYIILVKRLTGTSSDTSKSLWLDYALLKKCELQSPAMLYTLQNVDEDFQQILKLENTRVFRDGIEKLYQKLRCDREIRDLLDKYMKVLSEKEYINLCYLNVLESEKQKGILESSDFKTFMIKNMSSKCACPKSSVQEVFSNGSSTYSSDVYYKKFKHFLEDSLKNDGMDYAEILKKLIQDLKNKYEKYIDNYQFVNFKKLWTDLELWKPDEESIQITCALEIKHLCHSREHSKESMMGKIRRLARLAGEVLNRSPLQALIEYEDSSEYYLNEIEKKCSGHPISSYFGKEIEDFLRGRKEKHYCFLCENTGYSEIMNEESLQSLNDENIIKTIEEHGFYLKEDIFIWKLGDGSSYPIYFFSKLVRDGKQMEYRIRNLLLFRDELEKYIFNSEKPDYLHELAIIKNRLTLYEGHKSVSHTKEEILDPKYKWIVQKLNQDTKNGTDFNDSVESLTLMADLYVSRIYRHSITPQFYRCYETFENFYKFESSYKFRWGDNKNFLKNGFVIPKPPYGDNPAVQIIRYDPGVDINEKFSGLRRLEDEDVLLCSGNTCFELLSLLLSLILNVREKGRGISENDTVKVYLGKTVQDTLKIIHKNEYNDDIVDKIEQSMTKQPDNEESGITLWSLSCFIKRELVRNVQNILEMAKVSGRMENAWVIIQEMLDPRSGFNIKTELSNKEIDGNKGIDGNVFLSYEIPILWRKYQKMLSQMEEKE